MTSESRNSHSSSVPEDLKRSSFPFPIHSLTSFLSPSDSLLLICHRNSRESGLQLYAPKSSPFLSTEASQDEKASSYLDLKKKKKNACFEETSLIITLQLQGVSDTIIVFPSHLCYTTQIWSCLPPKLPLFQDPVVTCKKN